ncbi:SNF2 family N-terminal domain containing protein [Elaphomyces granulatus]
MVRKKSIKRQQLTGSPVPQTDATRVAESRTSSPLATRKTAHSNIDDRQAENIRQSHRSRETQGYGQTTKDSRRLLRAIEVVIPMNPSSPATGSSSSSSVDGASRDMESSDTPMTSVAPTPGEPVSNGPRKRISASARALELRSSSFSIDSSSKSRKRGVAAVMVDMSPSESSDAALARALQLEEYKDTATKRPRLSSRKNSRIIEIPDTDDESDNYYDDAFHLAARGSMRGNTGSHIQSGIILDSEESSLSDLDSLPGDAMDMSDCHQEQNFDSDDYDTSSSDEVSNEVAIHVAPMPRARNVGRARFARTTARGRFSAASRPASAPSWMSDRAARERRKLERQHPSICKMWDDLKELPVIAPVPAEQPAGITRKLKSFQLEGLNWMLQQEKTQFKGGLLGDEMGMGKTIQAVSLLMSDYPVGMPSLVVVPPVALMQWQSEIKEYTNGKLKVLIYHNSNAKVKHMKKRELESYDVIMISYSGLESMHRKELKGWTRNDGIVKEDSVIHSIRFHRLVLDEAHSIKQRNTGVARACFALKATYKWCLSGTPVQNRIGEFFSLLRFLEVRPFACYFCKMCQCKELHWSQDAEKRCTHCKHSGFSHVSVFNQEILNPITERYTETARKGALSKLRLITDRIMLRRLKKDHTTSMELPPKRVIIHNEFFAEVERDFSSSIMSQTTRQFDTYVSRGVMLNNYANIFGLIMQMRQVANHPDLLLKKHAEGGQNVLVCGICDEAAEEAIRSRCHHEFCRQCAKDLFRSLDPDSAVECPRCHIALSIDFEQPDIEQEEETFKKSSIINRIKMEDWTSSTKIEMLIYDLYKLRSKKQTHKSIVFSQFTSMLQLVEWRLRRAGFNTVMLDGSMTPAQRQKSIEYFMNNVNVEIFLVSLKAGGVALNLTEASRVFIVDPWWNPAAEWQSADRCHRIGQRRPCVITKLCVEDSVESRMVLLQEKKANMINGTINKDQGEALEKLTAEDMQFLFRGS